ncbi:RsmB/NOP family class I SAM-dependent RNA methyltransferase [Catellatospora bangladeshensis]|uniref:Putative Fmu protein (SUN protein) n=1 Tax=Catellatospora bangladeshensis TaxID=310355 RepID=A0A8J3JK11_9ACTN|nr:transcription antitermination factor NusB [Catellatospora bangladeshensis]GIF86346.1 putative Fmu protein (SUN protein) [Catellatospora bangladeshensis]
MTSFRGGSSSGAAKPRHHDRDARGGRGPRAGRPAHDPARMTAYQALLAVHRDDAYANLVLPGLLREAGLFGRDAAFATELTYGTLRARGTLDRIIESAADRDVSRIDPPARDALRLGAYQLLHTRVPAHAAVASTVDLVHSVAPGAAGFANAVMRRIAEHDLDAWLAKVAPAEQEDPVGHLAVTQHHPEWIVRAFREALGGDLAETERLLAADNERPEVHLCARPGRADAVELADTVGGMPGAFSPYAVYLGGGSPGELVEIKTGRAHVQDEGSQLVATALAQAPLDGRDERWLDLCAGPGGKAGLLAALAAQRGAHLTAVEVTEHRARMVEAAVRGMPATVLCADGRSVGTDHDLPAGGFDRVLVDAPCTGLGSLRRRPESRWRRQPSDLPPLTKLQRELLGAALRAVRPGGLVAYVTCSPHLVETKVSVSEAVRRGGFDVDFVDAREVLPAGMPGLGDGPTVQLWPHKHGTDAMFIALLRRNA